MKLLVNGDWREIQGGDLAQALAEPGYADRIVSTAVNGEFVAVGARTSAHLAEGDRVEVLAPMQGG